MSELLHRLFLLMPEVSVSPCFYLHEISRNDTASEGVPDNECNIRTPLQYPSIGFYFLKIRTKIQHQIWSRLNLKVGCHKILDNVSGTPTTE